MEVKHKTHIEAENGENYPASRYHETTKAVGTQQWVADQWADGALPTHSTNGNSVALRSSTGNFVGYQYPEGHGKLKHYAHIQAIRTHNGLIIGDSSCYARGLAHCSYPTDTDFRIDLTMLETTLRAEEESIYDIDGKDDTVIQFSTGREYDLESGVWVEEQPDPDGSIL